MSDNRKKIDQARTLAERVHEGDMYGNKSYIKGHLDRANTMVDDMIINGMIPYTQINITDLRCVLYLHDTLEDHPDLIDAYDITVAFGLEISEAVQEVTKSEEDEDYAEYILRIAASDNLLAICAKCVDLAVNIETSLNKKQLNSYKRARLAKYKLATCVLSNTMSTMWVINEEKQTCGGNCQCKQEKE